MQKLRSQSAATVTVASVDSMCTETTPPRSSEALRTAPDSARCSSIDSMTSTAHLNGRASFADVDDPAAARPKSFREKVLQLRYAPRELFIIYSIKFAESTAYYAFSYVYTAFLSEEFGFSDIEAGVLYTMYGLLCSVIGLLVGPLIDSIDLRTALLLGTVPSFVGRLGSAVTGSRKFVSICSYALLPLGAAFGMPVFALGVRRFTHPENRAFAFTVFYAVLCVASMCGGLLITWVRATFHDGLWVPFAGHLSWMRLDVLACAGFTLYTCVASCFVRRLRVRQGAPLESGELEPCPRATHGLRATLRTVCGSKPFWKLLGLSLIVAMGTRATFRHLDATFPKYFMRMYGDDAPFELFVAVEPVLTVLLSFPVTFLLLRHRTSTFASLVGGTLLQSFCPLALVYTTSYGSALVFVTIMALGEAIWSPRLYEYSTMIAPEGFEGTFVAVTFVPQYVSAGVVGVTSGYLLERYVPEEVAEGEARHPEYLWGLVAAASFLSPLLLTLLRSRLFGDEPTLHDAQTVAAVSETPRRKRGKAAAHKAIYGMVAGNADDDGEDDGEDDDEEAAAVTARINGDCSVAAAAAAAAAAAVGGHASRGGPGASAGASLSPSSRSPSSRSPCSGRRSAKERSEEQTHMLAPATGDDADERSDGSVESVACVGRPAPFLQAGPGKRACR